MRGLGETMRIRLITTVVLVIVALATFQNCGQGFAPIDTSVLVQNSSSGNNSGGVSPTPTPGPGPSPTPSPTPGPTPTPSPTPYVLQNQFMMLPQTGTPSPRGWGASAFLTGLNQFFIYAGFTGGTRLSDGYIYNLTTNAWKKVSDIGSPGPRNGTAAVWTGTRVLLWGGNSGVAEANDLFSYDPVTDTWATLPQINPPTGRQNFAMVWTGSKLILWGGYNAGDVGNGAIYDPVTTVWTPLPASPLAARNSHVAVWNGTGMMVWGGYAGSVGFRNDGAIYNPTTNAWTSMNAVGAPAPRADCAVAWTGTQMIVWGGVLTGGVPNAPGTGGIYDLATSTWSPTSTVGAPVGTGDPFIGWTGAGLLMFGGLVNGNGSAGSANLYILK